MLSGLSCGVHVNSCALVDKFELLTLIISYSFVSCSLCAETRLEHISHQQPHISCIYRYFNQHNTANLNINHFIFKWTTVLNVGSTFHKYTYSTRTPHEEEKMHKHLKCKHVNTSISIYTNTPTKKRGIRNRRKPPTHSKCFSHGYV